VYGQFFIPASQSISRPVTYWFNTQDRNIKKFRSPILATQSIWHENLTHNSKQTSSQLSCSGLANKSTLNVRDKYKLTRELVQHLPDPYKVTEAEALALWWFNLRRNGGLRLTKLGYETFIKQLELEHYNYNVEPFVINSKMVIALDRKLQQPWFIITHKQMPKTLVFFGSKEAMMANLYGDLKKFLDNYTH
jgi:hypothetical protein